MPQGIYRHSRLPDASEYRPCGPPAKGAVCDIALHNVHFHGMQMLGDKRLVHTGVVEYQPSPVA